MREVWSPPVNDKRSVEPSCSNMSGVWSSLSVSRGVRSNLVSDGRDVWSTLVSDGRDVYSTTVGVRDV
jgi:hypothetical protein